MAEIGRRFECGEAFVPELLIAARATKAVFEILRPQLAKKGAEPVGRVVALEATRDGLVAQLKIADGEDAALRRAAEGLYGVSIGFSAEAGTPGQLMRRRHAVVHEISLTAFGAYPGATVLAVRNQTRPPRPRLDEARAELARLRREGERT
jgi:HK97 family phage prohead protease